MSEVERGPVMLVVGGSAGLGAAVTRVLSAQAVLAGGPLLGNPRALEPRQPPKGNQLAGLHKGGKRAKRRRAR